MQSADIGVDYVHEDTPESPQLYNQEYLNDPVRDL